MDNKLTQEDYCLLMAASCPSLLEEASRRLWLTSPFNPDCEKNRALLDKQEQEDRRLRRIAELEEELRHLKG